MRSWHCYPKLNLNVISSNQLKDFSLRIPIMELLKLTVSKTINLVKFMVVLIISAVSFIETNILKEIFNRILLKAITDFKEMPIDYEMYKQGYSKKPTIVNRKKELKMVFIFI